MSLTRGAEAMKAKRTLILLLAVLMLAALLPGCGAKEESYEVHNAIAELGILSLRIAPAAGGAWSESLVPAGEVFEHGAAMELATGEAEINLLFTDENENEHEIRGIALEPGCSIRLGAGQAGFAATVLHPDGSETTYKEEGAPEEDM